MNILIITPSDIITDMGGHNLYAGQMVQSLASKNNITLLSLEGATSGLPEITHIGLEKKRNQLFSRMMSIFSFKPAYQLDYKAKQIISHLQTIIRNQRPDIMVFNHRRTNWLVPYVRKFYDGKIYYIAQNAEKESLISLAKLQSNPVIRWLSLLEAIKGGRLEINVLRAVDKVACITEEDAEKISRLCNNKTHVIPIWMANSDRLSVNYQVGNSLLLVGSFNWAPKRANALWLCNNIFPRIRYRYPDWDLHLVGVSAEGLRKSIRYKEGIFLHSDVPDTRPFFETGSIFIVPERQEGGLKIKTVEAASFGLPIISTPCGIEGTFLVDGDSVLVGNTEDQIVSLVTKLIESPELRKEIGGNAKLIINDKFAKDTIRDKWSDFFCG